MKSFVSFFKKPSEPERETRRATVIKRYAVQMEYVIIAVLIAAAAVVAVVVFGRSVVSSMIAAGDGASLQHTQGASDLEMRRNDRDTDAKEAKAYHDSMHK